MIAGELFIKMGIKDADKSKNQLEGVKGTLGSLKTEGLAAKAAIVGMVYGLQQLMSNSAQAGSNLMTYANATGLSAVQLQKWQYAASQANVSAEQMENAMTGLQSQMMRMKYQGGAVPAGWGIINNAVGLDLNKADDIEYMLKKLNEYAVKEKNVPWANEQLKSFAGVDMGVMAAMRQNAFTDKKLNAAPTYSNAEVSKLQGVNNQWKNLGKEFEMAIGHITAKHGSAIVKDISGVAKSVIQLVNAFVKLNEQLHMVKAIGMVFEGWADIFTGIGNVVGAIADDAEILQGNRKPQSKTNDGGYSQWVQFNPGASAQEKEHMRALLMPKMPSDNKPVASNVNVTNHINGARDPGLVASEVNKHVAKHINKTYHGAPKKAQAN